MPSFGKGNMRAGIYSPYLDSLGGGERYVLSVAKVLADAGWEVHLESRDPEILARAQKRFGLDLGKVEVVESIKRGDGYDLVFWLSDGSIPTLFGRKNILHFQRPFYKIDGKNLMNRMKLFRVNQVAVNSQFTKNWIDREFPVTSKVLYPPVDIEKFKPKRKENLILYVGRFSQLTQSKRQDVLVDAFKKMNLSGYRLVLAGGSEVGRTGFVDELIAKAKDYPIKILENPPFGELKELFGRTKFFWSAAGYGVNEEKEPEKVEHFGISVVEAMAAGCVPLVFNAGGYKEIIEPGVNGELWEKSGQLIRKTRELADDAKAWRGLSQAAKTSAKRFSYARFEKEFLALL